MAHDHWLERVDLAAAFRLAAHHQWHEGVGNHFSVGLGVDGRQFLLNPRDRHFALIRASELLLLDSKKSAVTIDGPTSPDPSAWAIHGAMHRLRPDLRCVLHLHPPYATALSTLEDPRVIPIDQVTARFFERVAIDTEFGGLAEDPSEGERIVRALGDKPNLILCNHGVLVTGATVAAAFDELYFLERAARTLILAYSTGRPLRVMPDELAAKTADGWFSGGFINQPAAHFEELKRSLKQTDPDYAL
jgi:ribulose-5-phosphate 4-epimerase/fuculose-1-phosphate aldolase